MKYPCNIIKTLLTTLFTIVAGCMVHHNCHAQTSSQIPNESVSISADIANNPTISQQKDSVEISLLTCSPRNEVYSLYGHTAIRYHNLNTKEDWVFNYGVFNFQKPYFVLRFMFGLTDYELGVLPFHIFKRIYAKAGCKVVEQVINLTSQEKHALFTALNINYLPENRTYRYNFLYDNCTTRARDIIESCIQGTVRYESAETVFSAQYDNTNATTSRIYPSYRQMLRAKTDGHPWTELGNDLCLGLLADRPTDFREHQFLPENLMNDFDSASIYANERYRPLVKTSRVILDTSKPKVYVSSLFNPLSCVLLLLTVSVFVAYKEIQRKKTYKWWDASLMFAIGVAGILITALFLSQHPTTSTNLLITLFNPIPLFFLPAVLRRRKTYYWKVSTIFIILFCIGAFFQDYPNETIIVALCLYIRCRINTTYNSQTIAK